MTSSKIRWLPALMRIAQPSLAAESQFRAGAFAADITPEQLPTHLQGMFTDRVSGVVLDRLHARAIVLNQGNTTIAIVVVDSVMVPREILDQAKTLASTKTGIPVYHMLIAATHTHSAPAAMHSKGVPRDDRYVRTLPARIALGIERAFKSLEPARIGWAVTQDWQHTHAQLDPPVGQSRS